jgi:glyoxylase-like metal-dependent hydrolase (beta-lactamase superfamily II)
MAFRRVVPGVVQVSRGPINAFLIEADHLTLVDAGYPSSEAGILRAVRALGRQPADVRDILVTHAHPDHVGGLAAIKAATGAEVWAHESEAAAIRRGSVPMTMTATPELLPGTVFRLFVPRGTASFAAAEVEHMVADGDVLPVAGGIQGVHVPGHTAGHLVFLWPRHGGVLFVGDAAANLAGLGLSFGYDDHGEGRRSLAKIASLEFAAACFGHGSPITRRAAERFRRKWGTR